MKKNKQYTKWTHQYLILKLGLINVFFFLGNRLELSQQMDYGMNDTARGRDYGLKSERVAYYQVIAIIIKIAPCYL